jgi:hypothetical protein
MIDWVEHENLKEMFRKKREEGRRFKRLEIKERFEYWESVRGAYIMSQKYRDELRKYLFSGGKL